MESDSVTLRAEDGTLLHGKGLKTCLHIGNAEFEDDGKYQLLVEQQAFKIDEYSDTFFINLIIKRTFSAIWLKVICLKYS